MSPTWPPKYILILFSFTCFNKTIKLCIYTSKTIDMMQTFGVTLIHILLRYRSLAFQGNGCLLLPPMYCIPKREVNNWECTMLIEKKAPEKENKTRSHQWYYVPRIYVFYYTYVLLFPANTFHFSTNTSCLVRFLNFKLWTEKITIDPDNNKLLYIEAHVQWLPIKLL